jgi:hypothetical protein
MKRLHALRLDHARPVRRLRAPAMLLAAAASACAGLGVVALQLTDTADQLEQQAMAREKASGAGAAAQRSQASRSPAALAEERLALQVRSELGMPWERLFGAIEGATGPDVSLLSLSPAPARSQVNLGGEARNLAALLEFCKRLQASGAYSRVYLREHHVDSADPMQPVRFAMELNWERDT